MNGWRYDRTVRSVVPGKDQQGVFRKSLLVQRVDDFANDPIGVSDHFGKVSLVGSHAIARFPCGTVRRRHKWVVDQHHWVVTEKRFVFVFANEVTNKIAENVRTILANLLPHHATIHLDQRVREPLTRLHCLRHLPQAALIEAECLRSLRILIASKVMAQPVQLPFARYACPVATLLQ